MTRDDWADLIVCLVCLVLIGFFGAALLFGWFGA